MTHYPQAIVFDSTPRPRAAVPSLASWLLPSFGSVVFAVALIQVLFLVNGGVASLFRDSDTGWHIRNGESILNTAMPPYADPFSYTKNGQPWLSWEWLSDAVLAEAHRIGGLSGVAFVAAFAIAAAIWGVARLALSLGGNFFLTSAAVIVLLGTTSIHWLARPHIFSWLLALIFLAVAEHERRAPGRALYVLPLAAVLWTNMHASFLLGPAILFIYAIGEEGKLRFLTASLACLVATFINPYGWRLHEHVIGYLRNAYLMDHIAEFRSFSFHAPGALYVEAFLVLAGLGILALARQRAYGPALLGAALLHMALYSARHLPTAAVLLLPLCVASLTREAESWPRLRPFLDYSGRLRRIDRNVFGVVPMALVLAASIAALTTEAQAGRVKFDPAAFPVRAADFLEQRGAGGRIFTKDQWGGYLIYRFEGRTKVFMDGRSDFYGQNFLETYAQLADAKPGWNVVVNQYDIRLIMLPREHALASVLDRSREWKLIYADSVATVFERNP